MTPSVDEEWILLMATHETKPRDGRTFDDEKSRNNEKWKGRRTRQTGDTTPKENHVSYRKWRVSVSFQYTIVYSARLRHRKTAIVVGRRKKIWWFG